MYYMFLDLGPCTPFDNVKTDCGTNGECVVYEDDYGRVVTSCKCSSGYYGLNCDSKLLFPFDKQYNLVNYRMLNYIV